MLIKKLNRPNPKMSNKRKESYNPQPSERPCKVRLQSEFKLVNDDDVDVDIDIDMSNINNDEMNVDYINFNVDVDVDVDTNVQVIQHQILLNRILKNRPHSS